MFGEKHPLAAEFHGNTCRWPHNLLSPGETTVPPAAPFKEYLDAPLTPLPPAAPPTISLGDALAARASCRRFADAPLRTDQLSALLQAAYGVQGRYTYGEIAMPERPVPSGGGLYPLELYLLAQRAEGLEPGLYHYAPLSHGLERLAGALPPPSYVSELFLGQPYVADAAVIVVLTARVERTMKKYGDRGYRYILFEAGHVAQNLNLAAAALDLGSVNTGGFFDAVLASLLGLEMTEEVPLYGVAVGVPDPALDRGTRREPAL